MIRGFHLADVFTLGNCGLRRRRGVPGDGLHGEPVARAVLLGRPPLAPAAFIFDVFDGRIARWAPDALRARPRNSIRWPT